MEVSLKSLIKSKGAFEALLCEKGIQTKLKYELSKALSCINSEFEIYFKLVQELKEKYGIPDDISNHKILSEDLLKKITDCEKELEELSAGILVKLSFENKIKLDQLGELLHVTAGNLFDLDWLIEE